MAFLKLMDYYYTRYSLNHKNVCEKSDWVLNHKNESIDFAFIGNSRVINCVDINTIEKKTGKTGINLGLIGANYAENYLLLDQFFKNNNKIKNLVIQIDMHALNSNKELNYPFHNYNYMHLLEDSEVYETFKDWNPTFKLFLWKYIPFVRYMEFSNRYELFKMLKGGFECKTSDIFDNSKGSQIETNKILKPEVYNYTFWTANEKDLKYLFKIIDMAKAKKIKIVLYTAPIYYRYFPYQLNYPKIIHEVISSSSLNEIKYIDFSSSRNPLCRKPEDFNDNIHMNINGVAKFSQCLGDSISPILQ